MTSEEIRVYQMAQLGLLDEVDKKCRELGICYYLFGGTLLGAVRHKGFIPWDADIDIAMWRDDYEKLCGKYIDEWNDSGCYFLQHFRTDKKHIAPHAILRKCGTHVKMTDESLFYKSVYDGIYLDIFPLDYLPNNSSKRKLQKVESYILNVIVNTKICWLYESNSWAKKIVKIILSVLLSFLPMPFLHKLQDKVMTKYNKTCGRNCMSYPMPRMYWNRDYSADVFGAPKEMLFEGKKYYVPTKSEEFLREHYGDYMKLPPESERTRFAEGVKSVDYGE